MSRYNLFVSGKCAILSLAKVARTATIRNQASGFFMPKNNCNHFRHKSEVGRFRYQKRATVGDAMLLSGNLPISLLCLKKGHIVYTIYGLVDPVTNRICYIGQTSKSPRARLKEHLKETSGNTSKLKWFAKLRRFHLKPFAVVLDMATDFENALSKERWWISQAGYLGWKLTNDAVTRTPKTHSLPYLPKMSKEPKTPKPAKENNITRQAIHAYLTANPKATQAEIRDALRTSNGWTHQCWHEWHAAQKNKPQPPTAPATSVWDVMGREVIDLTNDAGADAIRRINWKEVVIK